ncbi:hypothetical protein GBA52_027468 [Prunus armeniaca]|nr:hypothetical protein GBA52_027468 [Prunus armeniaca]
MEKSARRRLDCISRHLVLPPQANHGLQQQPTATDRCKAQAVPALRPALAHVAAQYKRTQPCCSCSRHRDAATAGSNVNPMGKKFWFLLLAPIEWNVLLQICSTEKGHIWIKGRAK